MWNLHVVYQIKTKSRVLQAKRGIRENESGTSHLLVVYQCMILKCPINTFIINLKFNAQAVQKRNDCDLVGEGHRLHEQMNWWWTDPIMATFMVSPCLNTYSFKVKWVQWCITHYRTHNTRCCNVGILLKKHLWIERDHMQMHDDNAHAQSQANVWLLGVIVRLSHLSLLCLLFVLTTEQNRGPTNWNNYMIYIAPIDVKE